MFSRKLIAAMVMTAATVTTLFAYDTQGKFGMGVSMAGTPVLLFSTMRYGVSNMLDIEPSIGFHQFSYSVSYPTIDFDGTEIEETTKLNFNMLVLSTSFGIKPVRTEHSNLVIKPGIAYYRASASEEYPEDEFSEDETSIDPELWDFSIKAGFGIEHFFTDNFSVYAGFVSSYSIFGTNLEGEDTDSFVSLMSLGNQFAELSFVWYL